MDLPCMTISTKPNYVPIVIQLNTDVVHLAIIPVRPAPRTRKFIPIILDQAILFDSIAKHPGLAVKLLLKRDSRFNKDGYKKRVNCGGVVDISRELDNS
jgi:hypothetical protein